MLTTQLRGFLYYRVKSVLNKPSGWILVVSQKTSWWVLWGTKKCDNHLTKNANQISKRNIFWREISKGLVSPTEVPTTSTGWKKSWLEDLPSKLRHNFVNKQLKIFGSLVLFNTLAFSAEDKYKLVLFFRVLNIYY